MLRAVEVSIGLTKLRPVTVGSGILDPRIILTQNSPWARDGQGHLLTFTMNVYQLQVNIPVTWSR